MDTRLGVHKKEGLPVRIDYALEKVRSRFRWLGFAFLLLIFSAALIGPVSAQDPRPPKSTDPSQDSEEGVELRDRDRNKILDNLDRRLQRAGDDDDLTVIAVLDRPIPDVDLGRLKGMGGNFQVVATYPSINGIAINIKARFVRGLAQLTEIEQLEDNATARAVMDTAAAWHGVNNARADFGVDGNTDGSAGYSANDMVVAVIYTGIDTGHVDLDGGKVVCWRDEINGRPAPYDDNGHGSHVAGMVAGEGQGNSAYTGVAPGAALVGIKVLNSAGSGSTTQVLNGIQWAIDNRAACGIEAINLSLGISGNSDGNDATSRMVNSAVSAGLISVVAAGNDGPRANTVGSPAAAANAITVGSSGDPGEGGFFLSYFSSRGPTADGRIKPDLVAPGHGITSVRRGTTNSYITYSGTSMATPFTAGVVALMLDANSSLSPASVKSILKSTAQDWGPGGDDNDYGAGRLDAYEAVSDAAGFSAASAPAVPVHQHISDNLPGTGASDFHDINVVDGGYPIGITMIMPTWNSVDFDIYLRNEAGTLVAKSDGTTRQETIAYKSPAAGLYRLEVHSYSGSGAYFVDISAGSAPPPPPDTEAPAAPTVLTVTVPVSNGDRLDLDWADNGEGDLAGYNVYRSNSSGGPYTKVNVPLVTGSSYTNTGLTSGGTYYYVVTAVDTSGNESGNSNEASGTTQNNLAPGAPSSLGAAPGNQQIALDWADNGDADLSGYDVYRSEIDGGPYTKINPALVTVSEYTDMGLTNGTTYYYVVKAVDTAGNESANSSQASGTPNEIVTPPTVLYRVTS
ncbi:MAG: hypothetical protein FJ320_05325 [SAR202 cluster bacterium]|nr:hypothetical protein [SAR202 cluster bacterium]